MSGALAPGPLPLTYGLLVALAGGLLGTLAGKVAGQRAGVDIGPVPLRIALVGLVSARLAFVVQLQDAYLKAPLAILDIRDGGWSPLAGLGAAALHAIVAGVRRPVWIIPLLVGLGTAGSVWLLGALSLSMMPAHSGELPPLAAQTLAGRELSLAGFRGKPTVINLWASWCPPCRREMSVLQRAQAQRPHVNFVFLNQGEPPERVHSFLATQRLQLDNVLVDLHGRAGSELGHQALPGTLFFDAQGRLADTRVGELSQASLAQRLAAIAPTDRNR